MPKVPVVSRYFVAYLASFVAVAPFFRAKVAPFFRAKDKPVFQMRRSAVEVVYPLWMLLTFT